MKRSDYILAVLAAANGASHTPVQVQKLFFLLDQKIPERIQGPFFQFEPRDYGPFDKNVYSQLETLSTENLVSIDDAGGMRTFRLTPSGQSRGAVLLATLPGEISDYISRLSQWVRSLSFEDLVSAIYREYPEMRANSVFRG
jgi:hypothetical protein